MTRRYSIYIYASATMEFEKVHLLPSKGFYRFLCATKKQCSIPLFRFQRNDCKETCSHTALVQTDKLAMWRLHSEIFSVAISSTEQYSMFQWAYWLRQVILTHEILKPYKFTGQVIVTVVYRTCCILSLCTLPWTFDQNKIACFCVSRIITY